GRDVGIEEIDVKADMQHAVAGAHLVDDAADQHADAELIDRPHVGDADLALAYQLFLELIDRARTEQLEAIRIDRDAWFITQETIEAAFATKERGGHAMHVGGERGRRRVVVGMRIEPEHEELQSLLSPMPGHRIDRTHRQRVIAAEEDRNSTRAR